MIKHLDLFSGIGGFALAGKWCWGDEYKTVAFCDNNRFCQELLKLRFPGVPIINDIRELKYETFANATGFGLCRGGKDRSQQPSDVFGEDIKDTKPIRVDLITGGFPCQPFSAAGKRKGTDDDRHLWPEMFRVIPEFKPTWVIAENVRGLLSIEGGLVFQQVCLDLESIGYEVQPFVIPACAVNAPHRRDRVWIVAKHTKGKFGDSCGYRSREEEEDPRLGKSNQYEDRKNTSDTQSWESGESSKSQGWENFSGRNWETNWLEVATRLCGMDDELSSGVDRLKLSKSGHRVQRLMGLGNAIVPAVALQLMKGIRYVDENL